MKTLCIGKPTYDIFISVDTYPCENEVQKIKKCTESGGGEANNVAYLLAKWKMDSSFAGIIGKDLYGTKLLEEYNENNINIDFLKIKKDVNTSSNLIITSKDKKSRTVFSNINDEIYKNIDLDTKMDVVFIDGTEVEASKGVINEDLISIVDLRKRDESLAEIALKATYIFISEEFAMELTNIKIDYKQEKTIAELYNRLRKVYANSNLIVILKKGYLYTKSGALRVLPCLKQEINDYFFGAFTYGIANKFDIEKSLKYANIINTYDSLDRKTLPNVEEIEEKYASLK